MEASRPSRERPSGREKVAVRNRRLFSRVVCNLEVELHQTGFLEPAILHELGLGGASVLCCRPPDREQPVRLLPQLTGDFEPVPYTVSWSQPVGQNFRIGLAFADSVGEFLKGWTASILAGVDLTNGGVLKRRQTVRVPCQLTGTVSHAKGSNLGVILDIGIGGALVQCQPSLEPGPQLSLTVTSPLTIEDLPCRILRSWSRHHLWLYGVEFTELTESHEASLAILLDRLLGA